MKGLHNGNRVFLVVVLLGIFAMAIRNVDDPDVWWHLKTGEYISAQKSAPHTDIFSYTRAGQPWVAHEWLTDLTLYQLLRATGFGGLIFIFAALTASAFFLLYLRCNRNGVVAGIAILIGALATRPLWGVRPQIVSLLLTSLWLLILDRSEKNPRLLWWTVPLTLLWVDLHAGFVLGLAISAIFLASTFFESVLGGSTLGRNELNPSWKTQTLVLALNLAVVPLNPNGIRMFSYPFETLRSKAMQTYIAEWASPNFHHAEYWPILLVILATIAMLAISRAPLRIRDLLLLAISLYMSLVSIRMIPFFVLIAVPILVDRLGTWPHRQTRASPTRGIFNTAIVLAIAAFATVRLAQVIHRQTQVEAQRFPSRAVAFLQSHPPTGPIFNHYDWGGYLIWNLPQTPVFIDGRADVYGEQLFHDFANSYGFKDSWQQILQRWNIQTVIIPPGSALAAGLKANPNWTIAYEDPQAVILTTNPTANSKSQIPVQTN
jgi:hypothetical protein